MLRKNLRKLSIAFVLIIATLFLFMPTQGVNALGREKFYTVRWISGCIIWHQIPPPGNTVVGEWSVDCFGNWDGWGERPGENSCTYNEITYGEYCVPE